MVDSGDHFWADVAANPLVRAGVSPDALAAVAWGQVYVATPYSRRVRDAGSAWLTEAVVCAGEAASVCEALAERGLSALSPIVLAQAMIGALLNRGEDPAAMRDYALDAGFWTARCTIWLQSSRFLYVPDLRGWRESVGIRVEVEAFLRWNRPVVFEGVL